jgi:hypothetical protein
VFGDHTTLTAYGRTGLEWRTKQLSWDGLKILEVTADAIKGEGWDAPEDRFVEFNVDVRTGSHQGGPTSVPGGST